MTDPEFDALFSLVYEELRRLASTVKSHDPSATLNPTALLHEAWLKLAATPQVAALPLDRFKGIAARAMRQVLVEAARRRQADKRGGGGLPIEFDEAFGPVASLGKDILALDQELQKLERINPRMAAGVDARFFGGFTPPEVAAMLGISEATVLEDWRGAKAWLGHRLRTAKNKP